MCFCTVAWMQNALLYGGWVLNAFLYGGLDAECFSLRRSYSRTLSGTCLLFSMVFLMQYVFRYHVLCLLFTTIDVLVATHRHHSLRSYHPVMLNLSLLHTQTTIP